MKHILLALLALSGSAALGSEQIRVISLGGNVQMMRLGESHWVPLEGKKLPGGTLVAVGAASHLEVAIGVAGRDKAEKVRIQSPMVVRLHSGLLKDFRYEQYPIERLFAGAKTETKAVPRKPTLTLEHALQRYLVSLRQSERIQGRQAETEPAEVASGQSVEKIDVLVPSPDSLFFLEQGRAEIPIIWRARADQGPYRVYLWEEATSRAQPLFETDADQAQLMVSKRGNYRVQVTNRDGSHRSGIIRVSVEHPRQLGYSPRRFLPTALRRPKEGIRLIQPAPFASVLRKSAKGPVLFQWSDSEELTNEHVYLLTLVSEQGQRLEFQSSSLLVSALVPYGRYRWTIQRIDRQRGQVIKGSGDGHVLEVKPSQQWLSTIDESLVRKYPSRRVLYVEEWP